MARAPEPVAAAPPELRSQARLAPLFLVAGLALVPWSIFLAFELPERHVQTHYYDVAWAGFDVALAVVLVVTGIGLLRGKLWVQSAAIAAATMLLCDAWFDVLTSAAGFERLVAIVLAISIEVPFAVLCVFVARNAEQAAERAQRVARRLARGAFTRQDEA